MKSKSHIFTCSKLPCTQHSLDDKVIQAKRLWLIITEGGMVEPRSQLVESLCGVISGSRLVQSGTTAKGGYRLSRIPKKSSPECKSTIVPT